MSHQAAQNLAQNYLKTKIFTATPEQLQLMLYDGAIRFSEQARAALQQKNWEQSCELLSRAQKIIAEMTASLKHDVAPDLCGKLAALYTFVYRKLIEANIEHRVEAVDEALSILRYQRETWVMLLDQLARSKAAAAASKLDVPAPNQRMEASLSIQG
ncbi:flagellar export chaperone FliS [Fontivita pretiosa]|uniref:flagellar export chaperone FliS n=1 Tax=Fontivita pretiosa TaxID=2989684 RepID=UPI003D175196